MDMINKKFTILNALLAIHHHYFVKKQIKIFLNDNWVSLLITSINKDIILHQNIYLS